MNNFEENMGIIPSTIDLNDIKNSIYTIRGQQVMLDSDLAVLYGYEVKNLNRQVKRNIKRFPDDFMFQLTYEEVDKLRCHFVTANINNMSRTQPYAFTEQGVYMLATVLKGEIAEEQSVYIMRAFREMRHFISNNDYLFEKVCDVELKQLEYQKATDERFDKVFQYIDEHAESEQKIFFAGQIYDAFSLLASIIQKAKKDIILIDGYVDVNTLNILAKKNSMVSVKIITHTKTHLTQKDIDKFNEQYPKLELIETEDFHDRFIILDGQFVYHVGASLKDAGKKCFAISLLEEQGISDELLNRIGDI